MQSERPETDHSIQLKPYTSKSGITFPQPAYIKAFLGSLISNERLKLYYMRKNLNRVSTFFKVLIYTQSRWHLRIFNSLATNFKLKLQLQHLHINQNMQHTCFTSHPIYHNRNLIADVFSIKVGHLGQF